MNNIYNRKYFSMSVSSICVILLSIMSIVVLASCSSVPMQCPKDMDQEMLAKRARSILVSYTYSESPLLRSHAIEALADAKQVTAGRFIIDAMHDKYWGVRFTACMSAMQLKLMSAKPELIKLTRDENKSVRAAAAGALYVLGDSKYVSILGNCLFDKDPIVRRNAATVLGRMGQKEALRILKAAIRDDDLSVRLQALEAMTLLGYKRAQRLMLNSYCRSVYDDECILAMMALARAGCKEAIEQLGDIYEKTTSKSRLGMKLVAARALAILGDYRGKETAIRALYYKSNNERDNVNIRKLAALTLGEMKDTSVLCHLNRAMESPEPDVQIAAACAILKIISNRFPL